MYMIVYLIIVSILYNTSGAKWHALVVQNQGASRPQKAMDLFIIIRYLVLGCIRGPYRSLKNNNLPSEKEWLIFLNSIQILPNIGFRRVPE